MRACGREFRMRMLAPQAVDLAPPYTAALLSDTTN